MDPTVVPPSSIGFGHFLAQTDAVGKTLLLILVVMSALSWTLILLKGIALVVRRQRSHRFLEFFWNAATLDEVVDHDIEFFTLVVAVTPVIASVTRRSDAACRSAAPDSGEA